VACLYVAYVVILYAFRGSAPFDRAGVSLPTLIVTYLVAGVAAGGVIGALQPLTGNFFGFIFVAIVAATMTTTGFVMSANGFFSTWHEREWFQAIVSGLLLGLLGGFSFWSIRQRTNS
jgi:hypothetical protein